MRIVIILVFLIALLNLLNCSGDEADKETPKPEAMKQQAPVQTKPVEPYPNSPTLQDLQPDSHVSGVQSNHASGAVSTSEHISGQ